jgi:membrane-associated phospholipid phosphatase
MRSMDIFGHKDYIDGDSFVKNLLMRLWTYWLLKAVGAMIFIGIFFSIYFYLLKHPFFTIIQIPVNILDKKVGFVPEFIYFYLSLWVYISLVPTLIKSKSELIRYGFYIGALCFVGITFYAILPTAVPPCDIDWSCYPDFTFLKSVDMAGNAFPSMHVATAFFSGIWFHMELKDMKAPSFVLGINAIWCLGIIYSTMATKQHVFYDVIGGIVLGGLFAFLTLRDYTKRFGRVTTGY